MDYSASNHKIFYIPDTTSRHSSARLGSIREHIIHQPLKIGVLLLGLLHAARLDRALIVGRFLRAGTGPHGAINLQSGRAQAVYAIPFKIPFPAPKFFHGQFIALRSFFEAQHAAADCFKQGSLAPDRPSLGAGPSWLELALGLPHARRTKKLVKMSSNFMFNLQRFRLMS